LLPFLIAIPTYYLVERKALTIKNRFQVEKIARGDAATAHAPPAASVASAPTAGATATGDGPGGPTTGPEVTASDQAP
jgi:hypothetical protein